MKLTASQMEVIPVARAHFERLFASKYTRAETTTEFDTIRSFWIGESLPPFFAMCVRSWLALDYKVELYAYTDVAGLPEGCVLKDAETILPKAVLIDNAPTISTRLSLLADIFRMALLARGLGPWCDTDYLMLRRLPAARDILVACQHDGQLCNAILWTRPEFEMMERVIEIYKSCGLSAWALSMVYTRWLKAKLAGKPLEHKDYNFHHWGRNAVYFFMNKYRLHDQVLPYKSFFVREMYNDSLYRAATPFEHMLADEEIYGFHFFLKPDSLFEAAEPGSFIDWAKKRFAPA